MLALMNRWPVLVVVLIGASAGAAQPVQIITAEDWARPRTGQSIVEMPALVRTVRAYLGDGERRILIRFPRGEEGVLWAEELRGWLVALGVPSGDVSVSPDSSRVDAIELEVTAAKSSPEMTSDAATGN